MIRNRIILATLAVSSSLYFEAPALSWGGTAIGFSKQVVIACAESSWYSIHVTCIGAFVLDPPGGISQIGFTMNYDSSVYEILPGQSGFLCDFSDGGYCPATNPNSVTFDPNFTVGPPRTGTSYSFVVTHGTMSLSYDMSANPAPDSGDRNAFAIAFRTSRPLAFQFHAQPGIGNLQTTSATCLLTSGGTCGSDAPAWGVTGTSVPEPASWAMMIVGFGMTGGAMRRRSLQRA